MVKLESLTYNVMPRIGFFQIWVTAFGKPPQVPLHRFIGSIIVVEIVINTPLVEVGRIGDRLPRRHDEVIHRSPHIEPRFQLTQHLPLVDGQIDDRLDQPGFLSFGQHLPQPVDLSGQIQLLWHLLIGCESF